MIAAIAEGWDFALAMAIYETSFRCG